MGSPKNNFCGIAQKTILARHAAEATGCLRPTPTDHLPILSGIQPAELRLLGETLFMAHRGSLDPDHILYGLLSGSSDTC